MDNPMEYIQGALFEGQPEAAPEETATEAAARESARQPENPRITLNQARRHLYERLLAMHDEGDNVVRHVLDGVSVSDLPEAIFRRTARHLRSGAIPGSQAEIRLSVEMHRWEHQNVEPAIKRHRVGLGGLAERLHRNSELTFGERHVFPSVVSSEMMEQFTVLGEQALEVDNFKKRYEELLELREDIQELEDALPAIPLDAVTKQQENLDKLRRKYEANGGGEALQENLQCYQDAEAALQREWSGFEQELAETVQTAKQRAETLTRKGSRNSTADVYAGHQTPHAAMRSRQPYALTEVPEGARFSTRAMISASGSNWDDTGWPGAGRAATGLRSLNPDMGLRSEAPEVKPVIKIVSSSES